MSRRVPFVQKYVRTMSRYVRFRRCGTCLALFPSMQLLQEHVVIHKGQVPYLCCVCGGNWVNEVMLRYHQKVHKLGKKHTCKICDNSQTNYMEIHGITFNHQLRKYQCGTCGEHFKFKELYEQHSLNHHRDQPSYTCVRCKILFDEWDDFTDHFGRAHLHATNSLRYTPSYTCSVCKNKSSGVSSLKTHFFMNHKTHDITMCYDCLSGFCCKQCFLEHKNLHQEVYIWVGNADDYLPAGSCTHTEASKTNNTLSDLSELDSCSAKSIRMPSLVTNGAADPQKKVDKRYPPEMYWPRGERTLLPKIKPRQLQNADYSNVKSFNNVTKTAVERFGAKNGAHVKMEAPVLINVGEPYQAQPQIDPDHLIPQVVMQPHSYTQQQQFVGTRVPETVIHSPMLGQTQTPFNIRPQAPDPNRNYLVVQTEGGTLLLPIQQNNTADPMINNSAEVVPFAKAPLPPPCAPQKLVQRNFKLEKKFLDLLTILLGAELVNDLDLNINNLPFQLKKYLNISNVDANTDNAEELILNFLGSIVCTDITFQSVVSYKSITQLIDDMLRISENWKIVQLPTNQLC